MSKQTNKTKQEILMCLKIDMISEKENLHSTVNHILFACFHLFSLYIFLSPTFPKPLQTNYQNSKYFVTCANKYTSYPDTESSKFCILRLDRK